MKSLTDTLKFIHDCGYTKSKIVADSILLNVPMDFEFLPDNAGDYENKAHKIKTMNQARDILGW